MKGGAIRDSEKYGIYATAGTITASDVDVELSGDFGVASNRGATVALERVMVRESATGDYGVADGGKIKGSCDCIAVEDLESGAGQVSYCGGR